MPLAALLATLALAAPPPGVVVNVQVPAPGWSPMEVESAIVRPLEAALLAVPGVATVEAVAAEGRGTLHVRWSMVVAPPALATREVVRQVTLPESAEVPLVTLQTDTPPRWVVVPADRAPALIEEIERTPGVSWVEACGQPAEQVAIDLDARRVAALGLDPLQVAGRIDLRHRPAELHDLTQMVIEAGGGDRPLIRLGDIAQIRAARRPSCECRHDGKPAVCLAVRAVPDANLPVAPLPVLDWTTWRVDFSPGDSLQRRLALWPADAPGLLWMPLDGAGTWRAPPGPPTEAAARGIASIAGIRLDAGRRPGEPATRIRVLAADLDALSGVADSLAAAARAWPGVRAAEHRVPAPRPTLDIRPTPAAMQLGLTPTDIARAVAAHTSGLPVGAVGDRGRAPVTVFLGEPADIGALRLTAPDGHVVPLSAVAEIRYGQEPAAIERSNGSRTRSVEVHGLAPEAVRPHLDAHALPAGVAVTLEPLP